MSKITDLVSELSLPAIAEQGCELWDTEYVREAGAWYLRLYIDKDSGVDILDCEAISRKVSELLDEADPIPTSYTFEVCSAGLERTLKQPEHFAQFIGAEVAVRLYRPRDGAKEFAGTLTDYRDGNVTVTVGACPITFPKAEVAQVRLRVDF